MSEVISFFINGNDELNDGIENPFATITIEGGTKYGTPLNVEGLMYILSSEKCFTEMMIAVNLRSHTGYILEYLGEMALG